MQGLAKLVFSDEVVPNAVVGAEVEGKYRSWFDATIVEVGGGYVTLKWTCDGSEGELREADVRPKGAQSGAAMIAGAVDEATYSERWFEATVVEVVEGTARVRWEFDGSGAELPTADVRPRDLHAAAPEAWSWARRRCRAALGLP